MLKIENINKFYGKSHILKELSLEINRGEVVLISGPNGSGKTTLLKLVLGMVYPKSGDIKIDGKTIAGDESYRGRIGYMPQFPNFPENLTGIEILKICSELRNSSDMHAPEAQSLVARLSLSPYLKKPFKELSGGNKQKINLLQLFAFSPEMYFLDEPSVSLDPPARVVLKELIDEKKQVGKTFVIITHILSEMINLVDRFIYLNEGKIIYDGSPHKLMSETSSDNIDIAVTKLAAEEALSNYNKSNLQA